jgi:hypothetical protein
MATKRRGFESEQQRDEALLSLSPYESSYAPAADTTATPTKRTRGEVFTDIASGAAKGIIGGVQDLATGVGMLIPGVEDNPETGWLDESANAAKNWLQGQKSELVRSKEAELSRLIQDDNATVTDVLGYLANNKSDLAAQMVIESLGSMAIGIGGTGAMMKLKAVADFAKLGKMRAAAVGAIPEGLQSAGNVYAESGGNLEAGLAGGAFTALAGAVTPGNVMGAAARKFAGKAAGETVEGTIEDVAGRSIVGRTLGEASLRGAAARTGAAVVAETGQELLQEGGEAAATQWGKTGEIDWQEVGKQAAVGAALGGVMGGGMHPIVGESGVGTRAAIEAERQRILQGRAAQATQAAAADPTNPTLETAADSARASAIGASTTPLERGILADNAATVAAQTTMAAPDSDSAIDAFQQGQQTSSTLRTGATVAEAAQQQATEQITPLVQGTYDPERAEREGVTPGTVTGAAEPIASEETAPLAAGTGSPLPTIEPDLVPARTLRFMGANTILQRLSEIPPTPITAAQARSNALPQSVTLNDAIRTVAEFDPATQTATSIAPFVELLHGAQRPSQISETVWNAFVRDAQTETGVRIPLPINEIAGRTVMDTLNTIANRGSRPGRILANVLRGANNPFLNTVVRPFTQEEINRHPDARGMVTSRGAQIGDFAMNPRPGRSTESAFLHETVHALTLSWLNTVPSTDPLYQELKELMDRVRTEADIRGIEHYGTHPGGNERARMAEFMAEAFTRPPFQNFLDSIQVESGRTGWDSFVEWVARLIGQTTGRPVTAPQVNALDLALRLTQDAMDRSGQIARNNNIPPAPATEPVVEPTAAATPADPVAAARQAYIDHFAQPGRMHEGNPAAAARAADRLASDPERINDIANMELSGNSGDLIGRVDDVTIEYARALRDAAPATPAPATPAPTLTTPSNQNLTPAQRGAITRTRNAARRAIEERLAANTDAADLINYINSWTESTRVLARSTAFKKGVIRLMRAIGTDEARQYLINHINAVSSGQVAPAPPPAPTAPRSSTPTISTPTPVTRQNTGDIIPMLPPRDIEPGTTGLPAGETLPVPGSAPMTLVDAAAAVSRAERNLSTITPGRHPDTGATLDVAALYAMPESDLRALEPRVSGMTNTNALARAILNQYAVERGEAVPFPQTNVPPMLGSNTTERTARGLSHTFAGRDQYRQPLPATPNSPPRPELNFSTRLEQDKAAGILDQIGAFWQRVMSDPDQWQITPGEIELGDLRQRVRSGSLNADVMNELKRRYNETFVRKAREWAAANGQPDPGSFEVIRSLSPNSGSYWATIVTHGVGRHPSGNPYLINDPNRTGTGNLGASNTTTELANAPGSGDIAYRISADLSYLKGSPVNVATSLLTNNNVRRQWQSLAATLRLTGDTLSAASHASISAQGMPSAAYRALTHTQKVGANALRMAHNAFVERNYAGERSNARAFSNLMINPDGVTFTAVYDPERSGGFPRGSVVTMEQLEERIGMLDAHVQDEQGGLGKSSLVLAIITNTIATSLESNNTASNTIPAELESAAQAAGESFDGYFFSQDDAVLNDLESDTNRAVSRAIDRAVQREVGADIPPAKRESAMLTLGRLRRQLEAGRITEEQFVSRAEDLHNRMMERAADRRYAATPPRARGADFIRQKLLEARRQGRIDPKLVDITEWLIQQNPALVDDLGISIRTPGEGQRGTAGQYMPLPRIMRLFSDQARDTTAVHEILHHAERLMPEDIRQAIRTEFENRFVNAFKLARDTDDKPMLEYLNNVMDYNASGSRRHLERAQELLLSGKIPADSYELFNASEFWAVNGSRLLQDRYRANGAFARAKQWLKEFVQHIKSALGLRSDHPIIAALNDMLENRGGQIDPNASMLTTTDTYSDINEEIEDVMDQLAEPGLTGPERGELNARLRDLQAQRVEARDAEDGPVDMAEVERMQGELTRMDQIGAEYEEFAKQVNFSHDTVPSNPTVAASPAAQIAGTTQPVAPANPNEIRIAPGRGLSAFERLTNWIRKALQDKHITLKRILSAINDLTAYEAIDTFDSKRQASFERLVREPMANIENELREGNISRAEFETYLKMRHAREYNEHTARISPLQIARNNEITGFDHETRPGSGIRSSEADAYMAQEHSEAMLKAARAYDQMIRSLQDFAVETGQESRQMVDMWNEMFPNYTPFQRDLDLYETDAAGTGSGFSVRKGISKRAMGADQEILPPMVSTLQLASWIVDRGEKARIGQTMLSTLVRNIPMFRTKSGEYRPMFKVDTMPNARMVERVRVYNVLDPSGNPILNGAGVPLEFYNGSDARAYAANVNRGARTSQATGQQPHTVRDTGFQNRAVMRHNPAYINRDNVLVIPVNGENHVIVADEQSEEAIDIISNMKNLDDAQLNALLKVANVFSRWVVGTATGYNPMFAPINFLRDIQSSAVNINSAGVPGWTKADSLALMKDSTKAVPGLLKYLWSKQRAMYSNELSSAIKPEPDSMADWMERAKAAGGLTGIRESFRTYDDAVRSVQHLFGEDILESVDPRQRQDILERGISRGKRLADSFDRMLEGGARNAAGKAVGTVAQGISNLNSAFELATRTAAFKAAYEKYMDAGATPTEAARRAALVSKNVSVNFNRRGTSSASMNALFPFFNAAMQGSARLAELLFEKQNVRNAQGEVEQKTRLTPAGKKVLAALPALGALQALLLAAAGYEDDQPPEHVKDRNFVIPMLDGGYLMVPMPLGLNAVFNMGRNGMEGILNPDKAGEKIVNVLTQPISAFNPLGSTPNTLLNITPAILDTPVALLMNKDAFDRQIFKQDRDPRRPTPGFTRHKEGTSQASIGIAEAINTLTGGNDYRPGFFSPTGDQIEYVFGQMTGGIGREVGKAAQFGYESVAAPELSADRPWYKVPLAGKFVGDINSSAAVRDKLYNVSADINVKHAEYKGLLEDKKREEAAQFLKENPEVKMRDKVEAYFNAESKGRKERNEAKREGENAKVVEINTRLREKGQRLLDEIEQVRAGAR